MVHTLFCIGVQCGSVLTRVQMNGEVIPMTLQNRIRGTAHAQPGGPRGQTCGSLTTPIWAQKGAPSPALCI